VDRLRNRDNSSSAYLTQLAAACPTWQTHVLEVVPNRPITPLPKRGDELSVGNVNVSPVTACNAFVSRWAELCQFPDLVAVSATCGRFAGFCVRSRFSYAPRRRVLCVKLRRNVQLAAQNGRPLGPCPFVLVAAEHPVEQSSQKTDSRNRRHCLGSLQVLECAAALPQRTVVDASRDLLASRALHPLPYWRRR
jgi:hypothetical protein